MVYLWFIRMQKSLDKKKAASAEEVQSDWKGVWDWDWRHHSSIYTYTSVAVLFFGREEPSSAEKNVTCSTQLYTKTQFFTIPLHQQDRTALFPLDNREWNKSLNILPKPPPPPTVWEDPLQGRDDKAVNVLASPPSESGSKQKLQSD